MNLIEGVKT